MSRSSDRRRDGSGSATADLHAARLASARPAMVWAALGIVYVAWGSTYVGIRVMDRTVAPLLGAGVRFVLAGVVLYALLAASRRRLPRVSAREFASLTLVSVLLLVGGNGIVTVSERHVPAGLAALLVASMPLWVLVLRGLSGDRPRAATLTGLAIGFAGVALLVLRGGHSEHVSIANMLVVLAAALSWAVGSWLSPRLPLPADIATGTAVEMVIGGVVCVGVAPLAGEHLHGAIARASTDSVLALAYLALVGSIVAFTAFAWLLQHAPISKVFTYAYVNPVVAVVLGALILGEPITALTVISGAIIVLAVAVVVRSESGRGAGDAGGEVAPIE